MSTVYRNSNGVIYANEKLSAVVVPTRDGREEELSLENQPACFLRESDADEHEFMLAERQAILEELQRDPRWHYVNEQLSQGDESRQQAFSPAQRILWDEVRRRMRLHIQYTPDESIASGAWNVVPNFDEYKRWFRTFKSEAVGEGFSPSDAAGYAEVMASRWVWGHTEYDV
jgi:hypothetical protein